MSDPLNHLGSIWYNSEPSYVPCFTNQFLGWDFFCHFLQQDGSRHTIENRTLGPVFSRIEYMQRVVKDDIPQGNQVWNFC